MRKTIKLAVGLLGVAAVAGIGFGAYAQGAAPTDGKSMADASIKDPPGPVPNPANIPFLPPDKLVWTGNPKGEQQIKLFGDPSQPGMYGVLIKWNPGYIDSAPAYAMTRTRFHLCGVRAPGGSAPATYYDPKTCLSDARRQLC